ncbi:MAG TPA: hypothetical protein PK156_05680 [Polyangium sp.]|nr:hypothetical protein [Polyangium sp.]
MVRRDEAITRVQQKVATDKLTCQRLCISEMPVDRDTLFDMTGRRVPFPETAPYDRCYVALLDSEIVAPWGHPALWAFIPVDAQSDILFVPTQFPENAKGSIRFVEVPR